LTFNPYSADEVEQIKGALDKALDEGWQIISSAGGNREWTETKEKPPQHQQSPFDRNVSLSMADSIALIPTKRNAPFVTLVLYKNSPQEATAPIGFKTDFTE